MKKPDPDKNLKKALKFLNERITHQTDEDHIEKICLANEVPHKDWQLVQNVNKLKPKRHYALLEKDYLETIEALEILSKVN